MRSRLKAGRKVAHSDKRMVDRKAEKKVRKMAEMTDLQLAGKMAVKRLG